MNTNTLGLIVIHGDTFIHLVKCEEASMKALIGALRKEVVVKVTSWELNPIYSRLWCFQLSHMKFKFGEATDSHWKAFEKGM